MVDGRQLISKFVSDMPPSLLPDVPAWRQAADRVSSCQSGIDGLALGAQLPSELSGLSVESGIALSAVLRLQVLHDESKVALRQCSSLSDFKPSPRDMDR